jgi:hypothetical protein
MQKLWSTYAALSTSPAVKKSGREVDAAHLLLGLLSDPNPLEWLQHQVLARDGFNCSECATPFAHDAAPIWRRVTKPRLRGADRPDDFVLVCNRCQEQTTAPPAEPSNAETSSSVPAVIA